MSAFASNLVCSGIGKLSPGTLWSVASNIFCAWLKIINGEPDTGVPGWKCQASDLWLFLILSIEV